MVKCAVVCNRIQVSLFQPSSPILCLSWLRCLLTNITAIQAIPSPIRNDKIKRPQLEVFCCVLSRRAFACSSSFLLGITLEHQSHQLLTLPLTSRPKISPLFFSSAHSGTQAPTRTILTLFRFTMPPMPSISCLAYPGPSAGDGVLLLRDPGTASGQPEGGVVLCTLRLCRLCKLD